MLLWCFRKTNIRGPIMLAYLPHHLIHQRVPPRRTDWQELQQYYLGAWPFLVITIQIRRSYRCIPYYPSLPVSRLSWTTDTCMASGRSNRPVHLRFPYNAATGYHKPYWMNLVIQAILFRRRIKVTTRIRVVVNDECTTRGDLAPIYTCSRFAYERRRIFSMPESE